MPFHPHFRRRFGHAGYTDGIAVQHTNTEGEKAIRTLEKEKETNKVMAAKGVRALATVGTTFAFGAIDGYRRTDPNVSGIPSWGSEYISADLIAGLGLHALAMYGSKQLGESGTAAAEAAGNGALAYYAAHYGVVAGQALKKKMDEKGAAAKGVDELTEGHREALTPEQLYQAQFGS